MPAVISAIASAIYASLAKPEQYKSDLGDIFPAMLSQPNNETTIILGVSTYNKRKIWMTFQQQQKKENQNKRFSNKNIKKNKNK